nr:hypothetical protein [Paraburkholderia hospita]
MNVVIQQIDKLDGVFLYDPIAHRLLKIHELEPESQKLVQRAEACLPCPPATLLWLVGVPGRTAAKYPSPESLMRLDAGFLAATISLVATALCLSSVPLGTSGSSHLKALTEWSTLIEPLGGVNIGQQH